MIIDQNLRNAIDQLYAVFERYPLARVVIGCGCCVSAADQVPIHARPLHELSEDDLWKYTFKALLTWGDTNDFRHFLPRIFELMTIAESLVYTDAEIILSKLFHGDWRTWPENEQAALQNYLAALWNATLNIPISELDQERGFGEIGTALCGIAQAEDDLTPYLQIWLYSHTNSALGQLNQFITTNGNDIIGHYKLDNAFWSDRKAQMNQVLDWLKNPATVQHLEDVYFENPEAHYADVLAATIDNLTWLHKAIAVNHRQPA